MTPCRWRPLRSCGRCADGFRGVDSERRRRIPRADNIALAALTLTCVTSVPGLHWRRLRLLIHLLRWHDRLVSMSLVHYPWRIYQHE
ncbi:hypothetical protein BN903_92 [Halorubrum sp. AJ67]|nr:hypothetical protein BN903_92 [Halorubrum sp. AJ67]